MLSASCALFVLSACATSWRANGFPLRIAPVAPADAATRPSEKATFEALYWAERVRGESGAMEFRIVAAEDSPATAHACAARLTASIPPCVQHIDIAADKDCYDLRANPSGTGASLCVSEWYVKNELDCLVVWPVLDGNSTPLYFDTPGRWLSDHHVVLTGEQPTVIDVREPERRFAFPGAMARDLRVSRDGMWLVIGVSGDVEYGQLDAANPDWRKPCGFVPIAAGSKVCDGVLFGDGKVFVTQEISNAEVFDDAPAYIRAYRFENGAWTKTSEVKAWWLLPHMVKEVRLQTGNQFMEGAASIGIGDWRLRTAFAPNPYQRLRVNDAGILETTPWEALGLRGWEKPYSISPSGRFAKAKSFIGYIVPYDRQRCVRIGPLAKGESRELPNPHTPEIEAWLCVKSAPALREQTSLR